MIFATRAVVLVHARGSQGTGWGIMKGAGGPQLVVHPGGLEVTIGASDGMVSGNTILIDGAAMCRERLGLADCRRESRVHQALGKRWNRPT